MLGIHPTGGRETPPASPRAPTEAINEGKLDSPKSEGEKPVRKHSFRLSFKRRTGAVEGGGGRSGKGGGAPDSTPPPTLNNAVPARFIRATSVRSKTLNPKWNEKFRFDIDDISTDRLHLDIWDHDDETSVLEAVSSLNKVRGVKGLGRFFKEIAQSTRAGNNDDFLGCVNITLKDLPSTGMENWYSLMGRSNRSNVQGRIKLRLWLSTREDRGLSEEDPWTEVTQHAHLISIFISHELRLHAGNSESWPGDLSQEALTILHQHAIQGDITEVQQALCQWVAHARRHLSAPLNYSLLHQLLIDLDRLWAEGLSIEEEQLLADTFNIFVQHCTEAIRKMRYHFPSNDRAALSRLDFLLRCLALACEMEAFKTVCPFEPDVRSEVSSVLKKGTRDWYRILDRGEDVNTSLDEEEELERMNVVVTLCNADLLDAVQCYHRLFDQNLELQFFPLVYRQLERLVNDDAAQLFEKIPCEGDVQGTLEGLSARMLATGQSSEALPEALTVSPSLFDLFLSLQEFYKYGEQLPDKRPECSNVCYTWFVPLLDRWMAIAKYRVLRRVLKAVEKETVATGTEDGMIKYHTSAVDVVTAFEHVKSFWKLLYWSDVSTSSAFLSKVVDVLTCGAILYADCVQHRLYHQLSTNRVVDPSEKICIALNDLDHVHRSWESALHDLDLESSEPLSQFMVESESQFSQRFGLILQNIIEKLRPGLGKKMFHLAWSPDSLPASEALYPLLQYLDAQLTCLIHKLLKRSSLRVLSALWDVVLLELTTQSFSEDLPASQVENVTGFHRRLYDALVLLRGYFSAGGLGLSEAELKSPRYFETEKLLQLQTATTENLLDQWYRDRLTEQEKMETTPYGILYVRAYFHHDSLTVEVIRARDIIPLDPNGFSDPFVQLELLPERVFPHCRMQQTQVQKRTLNPEFDEYFEFSVRKEQCRCPNGMILFTVMDHDVLTANDFAGEALLPLSLIPGSGSASTVDNFHGLKPFDLPLSFVSSSKDHFPPLSSDSILLKALEQRSLDRSAQEFVKRQKARMETTGNTWN
ncbi:unnamed protein product [Darwinula stevensoni]|uniref:BAI1-associated protein 3 n=1 Tax=Darwinula stevensoni TaxID=69355 RepID=A0A7R9A5Q8_9CRUS|nr:unnamed protein product [Darwinula stevensoni]CAG0885740.1 unnamed protein product [Darwinula stevensoni]